VSRRLLLADRAIDRTTPRCLASTICLLAGVLGLASTTADAQAWSYPSFQQSHVVNREFTAAIADGGYDGTSYIFQWREELAPRSQFIFDGGIATGVDGHAVTFVGGQYGHQLVQQRDSQPVEILGTAGVTLAFGHGGTLTRIPFTASIGHRFAFANGVALTPYVDPRVSLDFCHQCVADVRGESAGSGVGAGIGVGANLELSPRFSVRFDTLIDRSTIGPLDNAIGFGVAWSPSGLRRP
jgi:hypothetical protein